MSASRRLRRSLGNYVQKVEALARGASLAPGRVAHAVVAHDRWCGFNRGGRCDCNPTVPLTPSAPGGSRP
jgi:hypothetical protein